jgi:hypothetical protein
MLSLCCCLPGMIQLQAGDACPAYAYRVLLHSPRCWVALLALRCVLRGNNISGPPAAAIYSQVGTVSSREIFLVGIVFAAAHFSTDFSTDFTDALVILKLCVRLSGSLPLCFVAG